MSIITFWRTKIARHMPAFVLVVTALLFSNARVNAQAACRTVHGQFQSHLTDPTTCASPIGLCTAGIFIGAITGDFTFVTASLAPTAALGVSLYTGTTIFHGRVEGNSGDLMIQNAGLLHTDGNLSEVEVIAGGTGKLAGASGVLNIQGSFSLADRIGQGDYTGTVCVP